jgi:cytochrome oxidase Cu insertion factor (SCO1/SenC/PrrC family)
MRCTAVAATLLAAAALGAAPGTARAQDPTPLPSGTKAPDFALVAATKDGVGKKVHLHDYRGQTVVLAFFYKARTKG